MFIAVKVASFCAGWTLAALVMWPLGFPFNAVDALVVVVGIIAALTARMEDE